MKPFLDVLMIGAALSWGQCWAFCAPVLLPYVAGTQKGWAGGLKAGLIFSLGRIIPYVIWSAVSAGFGRCIISRVDESSFPAVVDVIMGLALSLLGVMLLGRQFLPQGGCPAKIKAGFSQGKKNLFLLGIVTGLSPCAPMMGLLVYIACRAENLLQGAFLGLAFGIGTLFSPLFLFASLAGGTAGFLRGMPRVDKVFSGLCGLILLYSGTGIVIKVLF